MSTPENTTVGTPTTTGSEPANLRTARKEQAAAARKSRAAHPAGRQAPAKAPAKKAPAANAPATAEAEKTRKAPTRSDKPKLRWQTVDEKTGEKVAKLGDEVIYRITLGKDGGFKVTVKQGGKTTTLADGLGGTKAYYAATHHYHWGTVPQAPKASA